MRRAWIVASMAGLATAGAGSGSAGAGVDVSGASAARTGAARGAVQLVNRRGHQLKGRWQRWADRALMPTVTGRVAVRISACPARPKAAGCVYSRRPQRVFIKPGLDDPRGVLLHELGHVYDLRVLNRRDRGRFRRIVHRRAKWWSGARPLAEQFAEAYSWCARYARIVSIARYSSYDYRPSGRQHRRICRLIVRASRDRTRPAPPPRAPRVTGPHPPPPPPPSSAPGTVPGDPKRDPGPQPPKVPIPTPGLPAPGPSPVPVPAPTLP